MNLLVAYDICTDTKAGQKRLRRVAQLCVNHGQRVQKSLFECRLDEMHYVTFIQGLRDIIHPAEDNVRIYRLQDTAHKNVTILGIELGVDFDDSLIL